MTPRIKKRMEGHHLALKRLCAERDALYRRGRGRVRRKNKQAMRELKKLIASEKKQLIQLNRRFQWQPRQPEPQPFRGVHPRLLLDPTYVPPKKLF